MKNGSWPSGVTRAASSHSTWTRPAKASATAVSVDTRSTAGCSPVGRTGKTPRFVAIPHDINYFAQFEFTPAERSTAADGAPRARRTKRPLRGKDKIALSAELDPLK
jgi:hypothetical protein